MNTLANYVNGRWVVNTDQLIDVCDKYDGHVLSQISIANHQLIQEAITCAVDAESVASALSVAERKRILQEIADYVSNNFEFIAKTISSESGKTIREARIETERCIRTFRLASEEVSQVKGEILGLENDDPEVSYTGYYRGKPVGALLCITPFNYPLNLVAHKIAPAIAAGCPFILKPALNTPLSSEILIRAIEKTSWPKHACSLLFVENGRMAELVNDDNIKMITFTGSANVGWQLRTQSQHKKVTLELGGNAACIVCEDKVGLPELPERLCRAAFTQAGQSCISLQRLFIHHSACDVFIKKMCDDASYLVVGDPAKEETDIGPMISEKEAKRVHDWVSEAVGLGAVLHCGGNCDGPMFEPTVLSHVPRAATLYKEEVFGPVVIVESYDDFDEVIRLVNDTQYGLQASIFTSDIDKINKAWDKIQAGGVMVNEVPTWRSDQMPYGGIKASGLGREGVRYAIEDMLNCRLMVIREG